MAQTTPPPARQTVRQAVATPPRNAQAKQVVRAGLFPNRPHCESSSLPAPATPPAPEPVPTCEQGSAPALPARSPLGPSASTDLRLAIRELRPLATVALGQASRLERGAAGFLRVGFSVF